MRNLFRSVTAPSKPSETDNTPPPPTTEPVDPDVEADAVVDSEPVQA